MLWKLMISGGKGHEEIAQTKGACCQSNSTVARCLSKRGSPEVYFEGIGFSFSREILRNKKPTEQMSCNRNGYDCKTSVQWVF